MAQSFASASFIKQLKKGRIMAKLIEAPSIIEACGNKVKIIK